MNMCRRGDAPKADQLSSKIDGLTQSGFSETSRACFLMPEAASKLSSTLTARSIMKGL
jgi:hypothetical protein